MLDLHRKKHSKDNSYTEMAFRNVANAKKNKKIAYWILWVVVAVFAADFMWVIITNKNFEWDVVLHWLTATSILKGLMTTLYLTLIAMLVGTVIGLVVALSRLSDSFLFRGLASLYVWFFRSTPLLVQLLFWFNLSMIFPRIAIALPFGPAYMSWPTNDVITPLTAAVIGLSLNEGSYMAEIIRGGLLSVDRGQIETAQAFGLSPWRALCRVIIPQAMRSIIPPSGNQLISMIKATSLVSVIAMEDLLYSVQAVYNRTFEVIPMLMVAVIWYLFVTSLLSLAQSAIERYYSKGVKTYSQNKAN